MPARPRDEHEARPTAPAASLELIERYLRMLAIERKLSPHTITSYRRDLLVLAGMASETPGAPALQRLTMVHMRRYAAQVHARGLGGRSIARALSAWRTFYDYLINSDLCQLNPVIDVRAPKSGKRLPKALPVEQAVALAAAREGEGAEALRDAAIIELLYSSGLRLTELTTLDLHYVSSASHRSAGWLDLANAEVMVTGKGGKQRRVPVGSAALAALHAWIALRDAWQKTGQIDGQYALFITPRGARISPRLVQLRIKAQAARLGIPTNVHPHVLRHSFASHVLQSSGDLRAVQELLGHASIASTQVYTSLDFQRLAAVYDSAHPRARKRPPL